MATTLPCRGRITELGEDSGSIETEHGTRLRFGHASCSGFTPRVGLEVWVMATRMIPVLGERATLVNLTGANEPTDPAERARLRFEAEERARRDQREATARSKQAFLTRARAGLPPGWVPGLEALAASIELPPALHVLRRLDERAGQRMAERAARQRVLAAELGVAAVFAPREPGDAVIRIGPCEPVPFHDASLVPFAQLDGEEPNLFALVFHPALPQLLPVIYWRHDDVCGLVTDDAVAFVAAVAHGRLVCDGLRVEARPELAQLTGLADPGPVEETRGRSLQIGGLPEALVEHAPPAEIQRALEELVPLSAGHDHAATAAASEAIERRYRELGWEYHARHAQFQRVRYFEED